MSAHMVVEFNRGTTNRRAEFEDLKRSFLGIGRDWPVQEIRERMNTGEMDDLINYRKDAGPKMGQVLADDFKRAMDELGLTPDERKRIATYFINERAPSADDVKRLEKSVWKETVEFLTEILHS